MTSNNYCGANEFCENYETCKDTQTCTQGRCRTTTCEPDEHRYNDICEKDSLEHCGEHNFACSSKVAGWKSGTCEEHQCKPSECLEGKHLYQDTCEDDSAANCGAHDVQCSKQIVGWSDGICVQGACQVSTCQNGLHLYENTCETDDTENCGNHGVKCSAVVSGWETGTCLQSECRVSGCIQGMHIDDNSCVFDSVDDCGMKGLACKDHVAGWKLGACTEGKCKVLQCIDGYHIDATTGECALDTNQCCGVTCLECTGEKVCGGGQCRDQCPKNTDYCDGECRDVLNTLEHCGECGHDCNVEKPEHAKTMACSQGACLVSTCDDNYHVEIQDEARVCKPDTVNACGADATDCTAQSWWKEGACTKGICVPTACADDYHLTQNEAGENWCEPDNALNCGEHGHECTNGQQCAGGRCLGNTICDDVLRNTLTDLDHCGDCNHRCDDGLICDRGTCKLGNGQAYCSGSIVAMGTIDRCSSCTDRCDESLICKNNACVAGGGTTYCSNVKIDSSDNIDNCGACNHKCDEGLICSEGECKPGNGVMYCNGVKVNSTNDSAHCSGCGKLCPIGSKCGNTSNIVACYEAVGWTYCSGIQQNTSNDSANCGQCGKKCGVGQICSDGSCTPGTGSTFCDNIEINTSKDSANCGQCGKKCDTGHICSNGLCSTANIKGTYTVFSNFDLTSAFDYSGKLAAVENMKGGDWLNWIADLFENPVNALWDFTWVNVLKRLAELDTGSEQVNNIIRGVVQQYGKDLAGGYVKPLIEGYLKEYKWYQVIKEVSPDVIDLMRNMQFKGKIEVKDATGLQINDASERFYSLQYQWSASDIATTGCMDSELTYGNSKCRKNMTLSASEYVKGSWIGTINDKSLPSGVDGQLNINSHSLTFKWASILYAAVFGEILPTALDYKSKPNVQNGRYLSAFLDKLLFDPLVKYYEDKCVGKMKCNVEGVSSDSQQEKNPYPALQQTDVTKSCERFVEVLVYLFSTKAASLSGVISVAVGFACGDQALGNLNDWVNSSLSSLDSSSTNQFTLKADKCSLYTGGTTSDLKMGQPDEYFYSANDIFKPDSTKQSARCEWDITLPASVSTKPIRGLFHATRDED